MQPSPTPMLMPIGPVNWLGMWTLYLKEVRRFIKVFTQTVVAPVVTTLLFFTIFSLAMGRAVTQVGGVDFNHFLAPGLIMMAMIQNAFANTSSSIVISKVQGNIVDVLMPPLSATELTIAYAFGGMTRGVVVGVAAALGMYVFEPFEIVHPGYVAFHAVAASLMLALLGVIGGIWSEKFDHIAAVTNFVVMPFAFLSGTFYSIDRLTGIWNTVAHFNPFFYAIDGFRYGFIDHADGGLGVGIGVMIAMNLFLGLVAHRMFATGYKLTT